MVYTILKSLALPPASFFILFAVGWLLKKWRPRAGRAFLWSLLAVVYFATTPFLAGELMAPLQTQTPPDSGNPQRGIGAVVVLGAGIYAAAPEYRQKNGPLRGADVADSLSLQRLEYAVHLARATGTPILLSGGASGSSPGHTVAAAMKETLERSFGIVPRWVEERSNSTMSNAEGTAQLLRAAGIDRVYLVTHAWHMPRAMIAFQRAGIEAVPAPTRFVSRSEMLWRDFIPSAQAFLVTYYAVHEWLGIAWYRLSR